MINFNIHFTWNTYFCIVILLTVWNLGFTAITRKGKLLYPILKFFEQKKFVDTPLENSANKDMDELLRVQIVTSKIKSEEAIFNLIKYFLADKMHTQSIFTNYTISEVQNNLDNGTTNKYWYKKPVDRFPDLIKDPIVVCITCMASVHGFIIYLMHCILLHHSWNPIEQVAISVPVAFIGEFFWKLKVKLEK